MFGRRETAVDAPAFFQRPGVTDFIDAIFYHGYDCNYGVVDGELINSGWSCDGLNATCVRLDESAALLRDFVASFAPDKPVWLTELCYATEFGDYNVSKGCAALPRLDFQDAMQWGRMMNADFNIVGASGALCIRAYTRFAQPRFTSFLPECRLDLLEHDFGQEWRSLGSLARARRPGPERAAASDCSRHRLGHLATDRRVLCNGTYGPLCACRLGSPLLGVAKPPRACQSAVHRMVHAELHGRDSDE